MFGIGIVKIQGLCAERFKTLVWAAAETALRHYNTVALHYETCCVVQLSYLCPQHFLALSHGAHTANKCISLVRGPAWEQARPITGLRNAELLRELDVAVVLRLYDETAKSSFGWLVCLDYSTIEEMLKGLEQLLPVPLHEGSVIILKYFQLRRREINLITDSRNTQQVEPVLRITYTYVEQRSPWQHRYKNYFV